MKLSSKISIHPLTIFLFFVSFLTGYAKYLFFIFLIVIIHEFGHVLIAKILKRKITKIEILPFGGLIKMDSRISQNIFEDLLIASGGIMTQCLFGFYLRFVRAHCTISTSTFEFLQNFNITMIIFNLIPIDPLDGSKMIKLFLELFLPFKLTFKISRIISISCLILLSFFKFELVRDNIFIFTFLSYMVIENFKNEKYVINRFYLERLNYNFHYKRKDIDNYKKMYKNRVNFIKGIHEKVILSNIYQINMH